MLPALSIVLAGAFPACALAEVRAVLVGVGDYFTLDADLKGPPSDVRLMADVLAARGVRAEAMVVLSSDPVGLADGVAKGKPTRSAILAAMASVAERSVSGDTVIFYFSGHGGQAPDQNGDEGGGFDEILLPADADRWKGSPSAVENAILDDELQAWAQGLLTRGVRLVGLIDACYSATGFRSAAGAGVARTLTAETLGIPQDQDAGTGNTASPTLQGAFVFLYSSQSDQRSFEYPLGDTGVWHGEFTLRLAEVLRTAGQASWAQVLAATSNSMTQGAARQVPDGEGPMLTTAVFGTSSAEERFAVAGGKVQAGLLHGLTEGTEVALYAMPAGGAVLGTAQLGDLAAAESQLVGTVPKGAVWAEVTLLALPPDLRLAAPVQLDTQDYALWRGALGPGQLGEVDLVPILTSGHVALTGPDGVLDPSGAGSSPRIRLEDGETEAAAVGRVLELANHSFRLRKLFAGLAGRSLTGQAVLTVTYERRAGHRAQGGCVAPEAAAAFDIGQGLAPCDQLLATIVNRSGKPVDLSVLYFNADYSISAIWPRQGLSNRLATGESVRAGLEIVALSPPGYEELMIVAVPVNGDMQRVDLTRLALPQMNRAFAGAADPVTHWLEAKMRADDDISRGFSAKPPALTLIRQVVRLLPSDPEDSR